jgi:hypothetical protein
MLDEKYYEKFCQYLLMEKDNWWKET